MRKILLLLALVCEMLSFSASAECFLQIHSKDVTKPLIEELITTGTVITFHDGTLALQPNKESEVVTFNLSDISKLIFTSTTSGIANLLKFKGGFGLVNSIVADYLDVTVPDNFTTADIIITSLSGHTVNRIGNWQGESVDVSSLVPGLYLITINSQTLKFINK